MTMMSTRFRFRGPHNRATAWIVAGACAAALTTGLLVADADLASLQGERDAAASALAAQSATLTEVKARGAELSDALQAARDGVAAHESALTSREGMLP